MCIYLYVYACYIQYLYLLLLHTHTHTHTGFPGGTVVKNLPANAGDSGDVSLIPGLGRSPQEGNGYPLQHPSLENPMERGAWQAIVHGVAESQTWQRACSSQVSPLRICTRFLKLRQAHQE